GEMPSGMRIIEASYRREYQMHGSIGPCCAVGLFKDGALTVWTHSQGVYPLRGALAQLTQLPPEKVRCIQVEGSGCYGHNGADDAGADAALLAMALPGRPVRVQWMREDEHAWEPYGSAMITKARAALGPDGQDPGLGLHRAQLHPCDAAWPGRQSDAGLASRAANRATR